MGRPRVVVRDSRPSLLPFYFYLFPSLEEPHRVSETDAAADFGGALFDEGEVVAVELVAEVEDGVSVRPRLCLKERVLVAHEDGLGRNRKPAAPQVEPDAPAHRRDARQR